MAQPTIVRALEVSEEQPFSCSPLFALACKAQLAHPINSSVISQFLEFLAEHLPQKIKLFCSFTKI